MKRTNWNLVDGKIVATLTNGAKLAICEMVGRFVVEVNETVVGSRNSLKRAQNTARWFGMNGHAVKTATPKLKGAIRETTYEIRIPGTVSRELHPTGCGLIIADTERVGSGVRLVLTGTRTAFYAYANILSALVINASTHGNRASDVKRAVNQAILKIEETCR